MEREGVLRRPAWTAAELVCASMRLYRKIEQTVVFFQKGGLPLLVLRAGENNHYKYWQHKEQKQTIVLELRRALFFQNGSGCWAHHPTGDRYPKRRGETASLACLLQYAPKATAYNTMVFLHVPTYRSTGRRPDRLTGIRYWIDDVAGQAPAHGQ